MAEIKAMPVLVQAQVSLVINEVELRALDALSGYGTDAFLDTFYKVMGEAYLKPYEAGLRSFLSSVRGCASLARDAQECREFPSKTNQERLIKQRKLDTSV